MINEPQAYKYCRDELNKVENYDKAIADKTQVWIIHHRGEILPCGRYSRATLEKFGIYWNRPADELIFMTRSEHQSLHAKGKASPWKGKNLSARHRKKIGVSCKGKEAWNKGIPHTDEVRKKISDGLAGKPHDNSGCKNPMYGKHHSNETKMKLSKALKGRIPWNKGKQTTDKQMNIKRKLALDYADQIECIDPSAAKKIRDSQIETGEDEQ